MVEKKHTWYWEKVKKLVNFKTKLISQEDEEMDRELEHMKENLISMEDCIIRTKK